VAITAAILIQLGFKPLHASGLALIANTAPVAFGSLGIPITTLEQVTGLDALKISAMVGRQLPFFSLVIPFWVVGAFAGWRGMIAVWPAALVTGVAFSVPQFLVSNLHGPWLVDIASGACSMLALVGLCRIWRPAPMETEQFRHAMQMESSDDQGSAVKSGSVGSHPTSKMHGFYPWLPWVILTLFILVWGLPE